MNLDLPKGTYVVAVSGGVDSVALLDALHKQTNQPTKLVVAHFDHGIRTDSSEDRKHVQTLAQQYNLPFVYHEGYLGAGASEAEARKARYDFLHQVRKASGAHAIVTAHHQDDVLETAILNILRGTGRKGLSSLSSNGGIHRPLLSTSKQELIDYAQANGLVWREDSTNQDPTYLRNYVRQQIVPRLDDGSRAQLHQIISDMQTLNNELDTLLVNLLHHQTAANTIDRSWFSTLPHDASKEVMAAWLRAQGVRDFDRKTLDRLVIAAKTAPVNKDFSLPQSHVMNIGPERLALSLLER